MAKKIRVLEVNENGIGCHYAEYMVRNTKTKGCIEIVDQNWVGKPQAIWEDENGNLYMNVYRSHARVELQENGFYHMVD